MGVVDLVIKVYFRGVNEKFPDGGVMSQHMEEMKLGDSVPYPRCPPKPLTSQSHARRSSRFRGQRAASRIRSAGCLR